MSEGNGLLREFLGSSINAIVELLSWLNLLFKQTLGLFRIINGLGIVLGLSGWSLLLSWLNLFLSSHICLFGLNGNFFLWFLNFLHWLGWSSFLGLGLLGCRLCRGLLSSSRLLGGLSLLLLLDGQDGFLGIFFLSDGLQEGLSLLWGLRLNLFLVSLFVLFLGLLQDLLQLFRVLGFFHLQLGRYSVIRGRVFLALLFENVSLDLLDVVGVNTSLDCLLVQLGGLVIGSLLGLRLGGWKNIDRLILS